MVPVSPTAAGKGQDEGQPADFSNREPKRPHKHEDPNMRQRSYKPRLLESPVSWAL